jgi:DNA-directed RNA polymerase II subunit RPB1
VTLRPHASRGSTSRSQGLAGDAEWLALYRKFAGRRCGGAASPWLVRLVLDREAMLKAGVSAADVHASLVEQFDDSVQCVHSDDGAGEVVFRLRLAAAGRGGEDRGDVQSELRVLEAAALDVRPVRGVARVKNAQVAPPQPYQRHDDATLELRRAVSVVVVTDGSNLLDALGLPGVDAARTVSNDVQEVLAVLGVEAARGALLRELGDKDVLGATAGARHLLLLADTMTYAGGLQGVNRFGINRGDVGPLAKASFEQTPAMLWQAGLFAERDRVDGVAANVMLGQVAPFGTGHSTLHLDLDALAHVPPPAPSTLAPAYEGAEEDADGEGGGCAEALAGFELQAPAADGSITPWPELELVVA